MDPGILDEVLGRSAQDRADEIPSAGIPLDRDL